MKALGIVSTLILVVLVLLASHVYAYVQGATAGYERAQVETFNYVYSVCRHQGRLIVDEKSEYWCKKGKNL